MFLKNIKQERKDVFILQLPKINFQAFLLNQLCKLYTFVQILFLMFWNYIFVVEKLRRRSKSKYKLYHNHLASVCFLILFKMLGSSLFDVFQNDLVHTVSKWSELNLRDCLQFFWYQKTWINKWRSEIDSKRWEEEVPHF